VSFAAGRPDSESRAAGLPDALTLVLQLLAVVALTVVVAMAFDWAMRWPGDWVIPLRVWLTQLFHWLGNDAGLFGIKVKDVTRGIAWLLAQPLALIEALLYAGFRGLDLPPLPWVVVVAGTGILAHWAGGRNLALLCAGSAAYIAVFGLWQDSMRTLAIVLMAVPVAAGTGLFLGIWATKSRRADEILTTCFDIMQATPHMAYLTPVVVLFGFGQVPAMLATVIFAMPPMARCVILGIRTVPSDVIEAGRMAGCTERQLQWKVQLPAAHRTLMLGLNQVVMQTLAMAVIASLVGASGLGQKLLFSLQQLQVGKATEQGIAIVLIAIVLDRLTQAYARREPVHADGPQTLLTRHRHLAAFLAVLVGGTLLSLVLPELAVLPRDLTVSFGRLLDHAVRFISKYGYPVIHPVRDWLTVEVLLPLRDFYLSLPWPTVLGLIGVLGWRLGGVRLAVLVMALAASIMLTGFWVPAMMTLYLVTAAVILSTLIGLPMGIWASRSERAARVIMSICDMLQTFPSFIYLIPVIMLLKVGDLSNIVAILAYASVPAVRYTYLGIKRISAVTIDAARVAGTTPLQQLFKVELPIALPEIMLGINQTIMMALAMTAITALIGSRDLGQEIYKALPGADVGRGVLAGLGIAFIGIIADRLIGAWANRRKKELGLQR